eukprot:TRINITY_DN498_c0_g1_i1.p1 TRINITY_DN498_c0_g1~~TRINITY_DN498_c0_g1_i1.p1  ORF type:complete len:246 (-),score=-31.43 TRINITY_DN498_c0_g1_i1:60-797(-)
MRQLVANKRSNKLWQAWGTHQLYRAAVQNLFIDLQIPSPESDRPTVSTVVQRVRISSHLLCSCQLITTIDYAMQNLRVSRVLTGRHITFTRKLVFIPDSSYTTRIHRIVTDQYCQHNILFVKMLRLTLAFCNSSQLSVSAFQASSGKLAILQFAILMQLIRLTTIVEVYRSHTKYDQAIPAVLDFICPTDDLLRVKQHDQRVCVRNFRKPIIIKCKRGWPPFRDKPLCHDFTLTMIRIGIPIARS